MQTENSKDLFLQSLGRCQSDEEFISDFYAKLMKYDDVAKRFQNTDLETQHRMMLRSLNMVAGVLNGEPESLQELSERALSHDRHHLDVKPELYTLWLDAAIETAQDFDPKWNSSIETAWRDILGYVISHMSRNY